ncbi:TonB-dependent receptor, partial [candidate division KSB1 bacterium]
MKALKYALTILLLYTFSVFAGTTGKINGVVKDSETGEPLAGANVVIEGTTMGASTDVDGFYTILNVPPGTYTLRVIYVGYNDALIKNVRVDVDLTTRIDIKLKSKVLSSEEVVVVAQRPVVQKDIAHSQLSLQAKNIQALPVGTVVQAIGLQ